MGKLTTILEKFQSVAEELHHEAVLGNPEAQLELAKYYIYHLDDYDLAELWLLQVQQKHSDYASAAHFYLGIVNEYKGYYEQAFDHFYSANELSPYGNSALKLARMYKAGVGVEKNLKKAEELFLECVEWTDGALVDLGVVVAQELNFFQNQNRKYIERFFKFSFTDVESDEGWAEMSELNEGLYRSENHYVYNYSKIYKHKLNIPEIGIKDKSADSWMKKEFLAEMELNNPQLKKLISEINLDVPD